MAAVNTRLAPKHSWELPYSLAFRGVLHVTVASASPADVFVVDQHNRDLYRAGQAFSNWLATTRSQMHSGNVTINVPGRWYVIVYNPTDLPIQVNADVAYASSNSSGSGSLGDGYRWR